LNPEVTPLITSFILVFLSELGDKTQLTAIMLSSKTSPIRVFGASMLAFFLVDGLSALIGGEILGFVPHEWVSFVAGLLFIFFGISSLIRKDEKIKVEGQKATFLKTFLAISTMEMGDKTQLVSVALAAGSKNPLIVLAGVMLAFSVVTGIGVVLGAKLLRLLPQEYLRIGSSLIFLLSGLVFIFDAMFSGASMVGIPVFPA